jgi:two-component system, OmpR family, phosphate regulon response regulator PhoB
VTRAERELRLGPIEYRLLMYLMQNRARVLTRQQLIDGVWGRDGDVDERTIDVHIGRLRKALNIGEENDPIRTIRGGGYLFGSK